VTVTNNVDKARQESKAHVAFYITNMGDFYREQLIRLGYEGAVQTVRQAWNEGGRAAGTAAVPEALVDSLHMPDPSRHADACSQAEAGMIAYSMEADSTQQATAILDRLGRAKELLCFCVARARH
jgi:hypothetical protein